MSNIEKLIRSLKEYRENNENENYVVEFTTNNKETETVCYIDELFDITDSEDGKRVPYKASANVNNANKFSKSKANEIANILKKDYPEASIKVIQYNK